MDEYRNIPASLKGLKQWVGFMMIPNEEKGKPDKVPINPYTLWGARSNDPSTWSDYQTAAESVGKPAACYVRRGEGRIKVEGTVTGIGFEFDNGVFGVDLDGVVNGGKLSPEALDIISTLDSYTEYSPSGTGVHILCRGTIPNGRNRKGQVEMYSTGRYFTVTGRTLGEPKEVQERTAQAANVHEKYLSEEQPAQKQTAPQPLRVVTISDQELISKACNGANGGRFTALFRQGDISAYDNDHSRADLALLNDLAYWTNGNSLRMDDLFRQSALMRDKWDEPRGGSTWGRQQIEKALTNFTPRTQSSAQRDFAPTEQVPQTDTDKSIFPTEGSPNPDAVCLYLGAGFDNDIKRFSQFKDRKTGFSNLDQQCGGLYPGLYVIGAISSLGKTTFVHQVGDQLAAAGDHVLFFSLEQNRLEMVTKSLSRIMARYDKKKAVSAIDIRRGKITTEVKAAAKVYREDYADRVSVIECNFNTSINYIMGYTLAYMAANPGIRPVVIVDYLQIIPPIDSHQSDKEKVDNIIRGLKKLQSENDLVVFVVSSINRANYLSPMDFESFKESGGIEYTADVVWGLQLQVLNDPLFAKEGNIKNKREKVREAKKANPRYIELLCLKNRYGVSSYSCGFIYTPQFDLFEVDWKQDFSWDSAGERL